MKVLPAGLAVLMQPMTPPTSQWTLPADTVPFALAHSPVMDQLAFYRGLGSKCNKESNTIDIQWHKHNSGILLKIHVNHP
ncbi:hypothetical protein HispidOSU_026118, partial [Sigmodon hispidus]